MLLIEVGIIETTDCSWNWIATLRFLWAKATIVSSHLTSKFRPDDDVSGDHRGGGSGERGDVPQTVGGLASSAHQWLLQHLASSYRTSAPE